MFGESETKLGRREQRNWLDKGNRKKSGQNTDEQKNTGTKAGWRVYGLNVVQQSGSLCGTGVVLIKGSNTTGRINPR